MLRAPKTGASREAPWEKQHLPSLSGCLIQRQVQKVPARHGWKRKGHFKLAVGRREPVAEREVDAGAFHGAVEVRGCVLGRTWLRRKHGAAAALTLSLFIHTVASEANGFVRGYFGLACCVCCS